MKYEKSNLVFRIEDRIPAYYVSLNGEIKFYTLAGMLLEAAARHANLLGFGYKDMIREKVYWVLSRFHTIIHSYPVMDEQIVIETWPKGVDRLFFLRDYRMLSLEGKLPLIPEPDRQHTVTAMYSDLDINKHVNAVKYIEWIQDFYDEDAYESKNVEEFQINYQLETRFGEEVDVRMKNNCGDDPFDYFEGIRIADQNSAFRSRIKFGNFN